MRIIERIRASAVSVARYSWPHRNQVGSLWRRTVVLGSAVVFIATLLLVLYDRLGAVVWLDDVPISSLPDTAVSPAIIDWWTHFKSSTLRVSIAGVVIDARASEVGCELDRVATLQRVLRAKKSRFRSLAKRQRMTVEPVISCTDVDVNRVIDAWQGQGPQQLPKPASLTWERGAIVPHPGTAGDVVARDRAKQLLEQDFVHLVRGGFALPLTRVEPQPDAEQLRTLAEQATRYIKSSVVLESKQPPLKAHLLRSDLGRLVRLRQVESGRFEVTFDAEELSQVLRARRVAPEWHAKNASLEPSVSGKFTIVPEMRGYRFSVPKLADQLVQSLQQGQTRVTIDVELGEEAKIKAADVEKLGIRELIGSFTTRHACCQPRVNNIHRIADLLDGIIVLPGETFSVNETIGPRSIANGFVMAPSIEDGEMVDTIGGGVSQFATTFYNALLRSGLEILERRAHTYWFDRYPMGHEATLSFPKPDLVFRNDTHAGVLIKTEYTDRTITVKLYGDKEGRQVAFGVSKMMEVEPPAIERLPNPEIRPDKEHTKNGGRIGWSVITWRTVTLANGEKKKDERKVTYKPQVRRVEVHPCRLRSDELGYTGEKCPEVEPEDEESSEKESSN